MLYPMAHNFQLGSESSEADQIRLAAVGLSNFLAAPSPLIQCEELSSVIGQTVLLKLEHTLPSGSFKIRGAFNKISSVLKTADQDQKPQFVTSSAGNHVLACCHVWQQLGVSGSAVFVPTTVAPAKEAKLARLHEAGLIRLSKVGRECLETELAGREFALRCPGSVYVPPYSDWEVIRGQGSAAFELLPDPTGTGWAGQLSANSDWLAAGHVTLLVPTGGGGLLAGVALCAKLGRSGLRTTVIGCQPEADQVLAKSVQAGRLLSYDEAGSRETVAQGTAGAVEDGSPTFEVCRQHVDRWCSVTEQEIAWACLRLNRILAAEGQPRAEPAAALGVAAALKLAGSLPAGPVVAFVTGGNVGDAEMELVKRLADEAVL
ncbi:hypothetical protein BOX15_Mlig018515g1 [Macrostomum lignano]|uniref:L-serine ammonia-lyase n=2 Tax=Macrostomum lignano TaxID=282301 RepID=A0A1I8HZX9_9PLAT|nr:hypothetical protein BOX15_Mlig018515g1 [Macrostomum lignano]